jgi:hypothetical protein
MRLVGMIVAAVLGLAVIAEGAYIIRTRSQLQAVSERLSSLQAERDEGTAPPPRAWHEPERVSGEDLGSGPEAPRRLPPPRLQVTAAPGAPPSRSDDPLPLPSAIDGPQAREQLRAFVVATLERERQENRVRQEQRQQEREQERRDRMAKDLGLSPSETEKFNQIFNDSRAAREKLRARLESGELAGVEARQEMMALRGQSQQQMQSLLGPERMKKYEQMRPSPGGGGNGEGRRGPPGGRFWGGGGPPGPPGGPPASGPP